MRIYRNWKDSILGGEKRLETILSSSHNSCNDAQKTEQEQGGIPSQKAQFQQITSNLGHGIPKNRDIISRHAYRTCKHHLNKLSPATCQKVVTAICNTQLFRPSCGQPTLFFISLSLLVCKWGKMVENINHLFFQMSEYFSGSGKCDTCPS